MHFGILGSFAVWGDPLYTAVMESREKPTRFVHKKSLGQHFLNNASVPRKMADAGEVGEGDTVLEIGPGTGALTRELLSRGASIVALEADARAIAELEQEFAAQIQDKKLILIHGDVREVGLVELGLKNRRYKVVANIPYYLSGLLFRTLLEGNIQPKTLVFLVQREVAERIARDPKESLLSLSVKIFGDPRYVETVKPGNFTPPPKVDSAIIAVTNISKKRLGKLGSEDFFTLIHEGFKSKRKQLIGNLSGKWNRDQLTHTFSTLGIAADARGEDLPLTVWLSLARLLSVHKKSPK